MIIGAAAVSSGPVSAQAAVSVDDIQLRDELIANQENLLNTYRCLFGADTDLVPGGCVNPDTIVPGVLPQLPNQNDIDIRDRLIHNQEALLNSYRCQYNIDTQLISSNGCPVPTGDHQSTQQASSSFPFVNSFTEISANGNHTCAIRTDQTISCWGKNDVGQSDPPVGFYTHVTTGYDHSCAFRIDKTIACWGSGLHAAEMPSGKFTHLDTHSEHACGIRVGGTIECWWMQEPEGWWGSTDFGQMRSPAGEYTAISVQAFYSCGLRSDGTIICWGANEYGQSDAPLGTYTAVAVGDTHSCALKDDGAIACWGDNTHGQLDVPSGSYTAIESGGAASCALRADGSFICWGDEDFGGSDLYAGSYTDIALGHDHLCALGIDQTITCWGERIYAQAMAPGGKYTLLRSNNDGDSWCGIKVGGNISCWGGSYLGPTYTPRGNFDGDYIDVVPSRYPHTCMLRADQTIYCDDSDEAPPKGLFAQIYPVDDHVHCALTVDGLIKCWQGNSISGDSLRNPPAGQYTSITRVINSLCGIRIDNTVKCWGPNKNNKNIEPSPGAYTQIAGGIDFSCALRLDGTITCWGHGNINSHFFDSYGLPRPSMPKPPSGSYVSISVGTVGTIRNDNASHSYSEWCALGIDQSIACWGTAEAIKSNPPSGKFTELLAMSGKIMGRQGWCGISVESEIACWGELTDYKPPPKGKYTHLWELDTGACALTTGGSLACWNMTDPTFSFYWDGFSRFHPAGRYKDVVTGFRGHQETMCALGIDDSLECWGPSWRIAP